MLHPAISAKELVFLLVFNALPVVSDKSFKWKVTRLIFRDPFSRMGIKQISEIAVFEHFCELVTFHPGHPHIF